MAFLDGFLLGLANGGACLVYCTPVLVPWLLSEGRTVQSSAVSVGGFLCGRLIGYLTFGVLAWLTGVAFLEHLPYGRTAAGAVTIALALLLIVYGFLGRKREECRVASSSAAIEKLGVRSGWLAPVLLGLLTGLSLCPPFLLAFSQAAQLPRLGHSMLFFLAFFAGTSLYVVPLPLLGALGRREIVRTVGRFSAGVVGLFYLYSGIVNVAAGMR